jgi:hypothetical protein
MTLAGVLLATHHGYPLSARDIAKARKALAEAWRLSEGAVEDMSLGVVHLGLGRASSEFASQEQVAEPRISQNSLERRLAEVPGVPRIGL